MKMLVCFNSNKGNLIFAKSDIVCKYIDSTEEMSKYLKTTSSVGGLGGKYRPRKGMELCVWGVGRWVGVGKGGCVGGVGSGWGNRQASSGGTRSGKVQSHLSRSRIITLQVKEERI